MSEPKKTIMISIGNRSDPKAICVMKLEVGSVVLALINVTTRRLTTKKVNAIPTRMRKAVLRTVVKYSNFNRAQNALSVKPDFRSGVTGLTRVGATNVSTSPLRLLPRFTIPRVERTKAAPNRSSPTMV